MFRSRFRPCLAVAAVVGVALASVAEAQSRGWDPGIGPQAVRRYSAGMEAGRPLVLGVVGDYHFDARLAAGAGIANLGDFAAVSGDVRYNVLPLALESPIPFVTAGFTQYYLADGPRETSPVAFQMGLGVDYVFASNFSWAARIGYITALGGAKDPSVDRYGISDASSDPFFALSGRMRF